MLKLNQRDKRKALIAVLLVALAISCRFLGIMGFQPRPLGLVRSAIYIFLFVAWGASLRKRIIQVQVRRYLIAIAVFMVFWFVLRTLKYHFIPLDRLPELRRLIWYSYYIPMLLIPMLALFAAVSIGKPADYRTPMPMHILWVPTILLIVAVLTNDLHQMVFSFPADYPVWIDDHYSHAFLYFVVMAWLLGSAIAAIATILHKCRIPHSRKFFWLPIIPFALMIIYGVLYLVAMPVISLLAGDMAAVSCVLGVLIFEGCIQCGLIPSNSHYEELLRASTLAAQIADNSLTVRYAAENAKAVEKSVLEEAKESDIMLDGGTRLCAATIRGGYVFWQEDVSPILAVLAELSDTKEELQSYGGLLAEENKQKKRQKKLEEQQRIFNAVQKDVASHLTLLTALSKKLQMATDETAAKELLGKISVIGAYLKRRGNLILLADRTGMIPATELYLCLKETAYNMRLYGVTCAVCFEIEGDISPDAAGLFFDFYETVAELSLDTLTDVTAFAARETAGLRLTLILSCGADMTQLTKRFDDASVTQENGAWYCTLAIPEGGAST